MYQRCETRWLLFRLIQWHFIANNAWNLKIFMSSFLFLLFSPIYFTLLLSPLLQYGSSRNIGMIWTPLPCRPCPCLWSMLPVWSVLSRCPPQSTPTHQTAFCPAPHVAWLQACTLSRPPAPQWAPQLFPTCPTFRLKGWMHLPNARCPSTQALLPLPGRLTLPYSTTCTSTASTVFLWLRAPHRHTSECPSRPTRLGVTPWVWGWCMDRLLRHPPLECLRGLAPALATQPVRVASRSWPPLPLTFTL